MRAFYQYVHLLANEICKLKVFLIFKRVNCWGEEVRSSISRLTALQMQCSKSKAISSIYQRLNSLQC